MKSALKEREKDVEELNAQRIDDIKIKKTEQKNRLVAKIQRKKIKGIYPNHLYSTSSSKKAHEEKKG